MQVQVPVTASSEPPSSDVEELEEVIDLADDSPPSSPAHSPFSLRNAI